MSDYQKEQHIPCENCLILPICKMKVKELDPTLLGHGWYSLYNRCEIFQDYYNFFVFQGMLFEVEKKLGDFFKSPKHKTMIEEFIVK